MKSKTRSLVSLALAISCQGIVPLIAQNRNDAVKVSMYIDFISWGEDIEGLEVHQLDRSTPVKALAFRYSEPLEYSGSQILALALGQGGEVAAKRKAEALDAWRRSRKEERIEVPEAILAPKAFADAAKGVGGEIPKALAAARNKDPVLAALVKLPANSRRVTILLAPGPDRSLVPHIFDDDPTRQPLGKVRVHNFSPYPISLITNSKQSGALAPGKNFIASAPRGTFAYELAYKIDGAWKIQENNLLSIRPDEQMHMVVLRNGSSFFSSSDGSRGGFMQTALLRRGPQPARKGDDE